MSITQNNVLKRARAIKAERPSISKDEMRRLLHREFVTLAPSGRGEGVPHRAVANPLDWLVGLKLLLSGGARWMKGDKTKAVVEMIEGVLVILF